MSGMQKAAEAFSCLEEAARIGERLRPLLVSRGKAKLVLVGGGGMSSANVLQALKENVPPAKIGAGVYDPYGIFHALARACPPRKEGLRVVWVTAASDEAKEAVPERKAHLLLPGMRTKYGIGEAQVFDLADPRQADDPAVAEAFRRADLIFFGGGKQNNLIDRLPRESLVFKALKAQFDNPRAVIGGTSAGAMVMTQNAITGGDVRSIVRQMRPGFGFLSNMLVDTHFDERHRESRLTAAMASRPGCAGLGLGECSVLVIEGGVARVLGEGRVTLYEPLAAEGSRLPWKKSVFRKGESFRLEPFFTGLPEKIPETRPLVRSRAAER